MIIDCHGEGLFRLVLADDILVECFLDPGGRHQFAHGGGFGQLSTQGLVFFTEDFFTEADTFVADENAGAGNQAADLAFGFAAERARNRNIAFRVTRS